MTHRLFVYGTLRRGFANPNAELLHRQATWLGHGRISGRLLLLGTLPDSGQPYPGLFAPSPAGSSSVVGDVFELAHPDLLLPRLDHYEGIGPEFPAPHEYTRRLVEVELGGRNLSCWCYLCQRPTAGLAEIASGDFLAWTVENGPKPTAPTANFQFPNSI